MANQQVDLSLAALLQLIVKHLKIFLIVGIVTVIVASIVSLLLTEYYKSTVVIFPAEISSVTLNESGVKRGNISDFGEEEEAEQLLQVINSEDLQERVIKRHNLYAHYEIDPSDRYARSDIRQQYNNNVTAKRTKYNSIDISVIDKVPQMAADIANSIAEFTDSVKNRMIQERAKISMPMISAETERLESELQSVQSELAKLKAQGILGEVERASLFEAYGNASGTAARDLKEQLEINRDQGSKYDALARKRDMIIDQQLRFRNLRNQMMADATIAIPQKFVVDHAIPADKKSFPVRWLIVAGSLASVLLFTLLILIFRENAESILPQ